MFSTTHVEVHGDGGIYLDWLAIQEVWLVRPLSHRGEGCDCKTDIGRGYEFEVCYVPIGSDESGEYD